MSSWMKRALQLRFGGAKEVSLTESVSMLMVAPERRRSKKSFQRTVLEIGGLPPILPPDLSTEPTRYDN